jgi:PAS domain S-box-containing protein
MAEPVISKDHVTESPRTPAGISGPGDAEHYRRQLETVAQNATLALFIMDEQQRCTYMNRAAEEMTGFSLAELQGRALHYYVHHSYPDGRPYPLEECPIDRAFPQNMREHGEEVFVHKDGHFYPVAFTASPIRDGDRTVGTIIEARDITRERAEAAERDSLVAELRTERARLATVFQQAPAFIATLRGPDHVFEMANPVYYQVVGHRDLLGRPVREALPEAVDQGFLALLDQVYRSGEPFVGNGMRILLERTPGAAPEERFVNFVYQPLVEADGSVSGIMAHGVDVTEQVESQRRSEEQAVEIETQKEELQLQAARMEEVQVELELSNEELQETNESLTRERAHLSAIIEHAPVGIVIAEAPSGQIVLGNRRVEEIFRHPAFRSGSVEEYADWVAFHEDGRQVQVHEYPLARVLRTGRPAGPDQYLYQRGDGTRAWVQITGAPIRDAAGTLTGGLAVIDDIDEERRGKLERERLIRELELERSRLRTILTEAPAQIAVVRGPEYVFEFANPRYLANAAGRELLGRPALEVFPELASQGFREMLDTAYHGGEPLSLEEVPAAVDRDGTGVMEEGYYNLVLQPLRDADGRVDALLSHTIDVTGQVRARREVEQLEERLRLALDAAELGIFDWDLGSGELSWDARARRIFGVAPEGALTIDMFQERVHPDDRERVGREVQQALDPAGTGEFTSVYCVSPPGGEERWVRAVGRVYFEGEGDGRRAVRFLGTAQDVTERQQAEAERERLLREMEMGRARLQQIFTEAPAVMALYTGPEHVVTMVNPTWEQTVGKPGAVGRPFREVFPEFAGTGLFELLDQVYETGEPFVDPEVNVPLERFGSGVLEDTYWSLVWRPLAGEGPRGRDVLVHAVDVTTQVRARREVEEKAEELARAARALEASNQELDQFAYVASHDLKAPLRGIANLATWIAEDLGDAASGEVQEHLGLLQGRVHRMEGLIDGILQYSRAGRVREPAVPVDTGELVHEVVDLIAPPRGVAVEVADGMPELRTERLPLQQVFMNLIGNAVKYAGGASPRVQVSARDAGGMWEFAVRDNGPGIAPRYHERIFGIFQTLEARDKVEGTGIGLSIVRKLVESRGGRVWVESEEGAGSTFRFLWPASHEESSVHE